MSTFSDELAFSTRANFEIRDITNDVAEIVNTSNISNGLVNVFVIGSTAAVTTIEHESGLLQDIKDLLEELIPQGRDWHHNSAWDEGNGHSHLRSSLIGPSLTIPIVNGRMPLGTWQQIVYIDFDVKPRSRRVTIQIVGE